MYLIDIDTVVANLTGMPAVSVPSGFVENLPVGVQVMADSFQEQTLLDAASTIENGLGIQRSPDL
jgi:aspartyl-tRNA(Asn)/glutamyl-tRNA(Gln) amidotransferase subunit A